jgi:hypothetical protein
MPESICAIISTGMHVPLRTSPVGHHILLISGFFCFLQLGAVFGQYEA